jgi:hypothetical protein
MLAMRAKKGKHAPHHQIDEKDENEQKPSEPYFVGVLFKSKSTEINSRKIFLVL